MSEVVINSKRLYPCLRWMSLCILLCIGAVAHAQVTTDTIQIKGLVILKSKNTNGRTSYKFYNDTTYINNKLKKNLHTRWLVFDLGFNNYTDKSNYGGASYLAYYPTTTYYAANRTYDYSAQGLNNFAPRYGSSPLTASEFKLITGKSVNVNIWLFMQRLNLFKHKLNLQYALGVEMNNYRFARDITFKPGYPTTVFRDSVSFSKNKMFAEYLSIPLMLNYTANPYRPNRSFKISGGIMGGYLIKARTKQISAERGKVKVDDDFNLNKWRFSLTGEVGYGPVKLYSNFALTALHDYGLLQYPFSVGFRFNGF